MKTLWQRRELLRAALHCGVLTLTGCGTVLHPERRGQPAGRLDWGVVALDAIGLLFFFIPGVIAFAVDFSTGAIYLPPDYPPGSYPLAHGPLERVPTDSARPSQEEVEALVSQRVGQPVRLTPGGFISQPLADLGEFWALEKRYRSSNSPA